MFSFLKMHGLGNDFIVIDRRKAPLDLTPEQFKQIADRRFGIGCDQVVLIDKPESPDADAFMRIRNADGSIAETCGNAARCLGHLLMKETGKASVILQTVVGVMHCSRTGIVINGQDTVTVDMGAPWLKALEIPLTQEVDTLHIPLDVEGYSDPVAVSMGNPHAVFFVQDIGLVPLERVGAQVEVHPLFPKKTNVEFVQKISDTHLRMRVWERGAGVTSACGTGACATLVAAVRRGLVAPNTPCRIELDGGDLVIAWGGAGTSVMMTGSATTVFSGNFIESLV